VVVSIAAVMMVAECVCIMWFVIVIVSVRMCAIV